MTNSNFPQGFAAGLTVRNMPILNAYPGKVFWVHSATQSGGVRGTFDKPFTSIEEALDACVANRGDIIAMKAGHSETVATAGAITIDKAGVALVGLGVGSLRPTINFNGVVGADLNVNAANVTMANMLFTGGLDALTGPLDINAADCSLINIETRDVTGQATDFIVTDDNCDRLCISGWKHLGAAAAGADTAISLVGGDDWVIEAFDIYGNFAVGAIENVTTAANRVRIGGGPRANYIWTENSADVCITMAAASTGWIGPNLYLMLQDNAANFAGATVGSAMQFMKPIQIVNLAGESSADTTITASTNA